MQKVMEENPFTGTLLRKQRPESTCSLQPTYHFDESYRLHDPIQFISEPNTVDSAYSTYSHTPDVVTVFPFPKSHSGQSLMNVRRL